LILNFNHYHTLFDLVKPTLTLARALRAELDPHLVTGHGEVDTPLPGFEGRGWGMG